MREIKFRMWHKNIKQMYDVGVINLQQGLVFMKNYLSYTQSSFAIEEVELMQYTGLKDENGKEVYEGDILEKIYTDYNDKEFFREKYLVQNNICGWELRNLKKPKSHRSFQLLKKCKIIGNIYKNPELLEDK